MSRELRQMIVDMDDEALDYEITHTTSYHTEFYRALCVERQERQERAARAQHSEEARREEFTHAA